MPSLAPVIAGPDIGQVYFKKERDHYAHSLSETCSLTDRVFKDGSSKLALNFIDYIFENPKKANTLPSDKQLARFYSGMIRQHIERRILFFFQQLIVCYQTKLHFESVGAQDQGASADAIIISIKGEQHKFSKRNAAHSSTSPCIVAYDNQEWQQYQEGLIDKPQGFVFLKGTDYYRTANATMNMPHVINEADREIDEKTIHSLLREKSEKIINKVAQGELTPDQGIMEFLKDGIFEVEAAQKRLKKADKDPGVQEVLAYYLKYFNENQSIIEKDPTFLEKFLDFKIDSSVHGEEAKRTILEIRYGIIRNSQIDQSKLIQKIVALKTEVFTELNTDRKPDNFDAAFLTKLIEGAETDQDRHRLEKLLNFSPDNFKAQLKGATKSKFTTTLALLSPQTEKITFIARDILHNMKDLRAHEQNDRAQILKKLRNMNGWTYAQLGAELKKRFPKAPASPSFIQRIENCEILVTSKIAVAFSRVFKVDPGLFMPHFYYE